MSDAGKFNPHQLAVMKQAIRCRGKSQQVTKAIEEMAELTKELCKWLYADVPVKSGGLRPAQIENKIREEIADVHIMLHQMRVIFGDQVLDTMIALKLSRLETLLPEVANGGD